MSPKRLIALAGGPAPAAVLVVGLVQLAGSPPREFKLERDVQRYAMVG